MSTYATQKNVEDYIEGWVTDDAFALERLILRSERDVDRVVRSLNRILPPTQVIMLKGATTGNLVLSWNGQVASAEPYNESASQMQISLGTLAGISAANVTVLGGYPIWTVVWDPTWAVQFTNFNVPVIALDSSSTADGIFSVTSVAGRRISPVTDLNFNQAQMLANAACAQVEYRAQMGPKFFVQPQYKSVRGPDFTTTGVLPKVAPKVLKELTGSGLLLTSGRARVSRRRRRGVGLGWANF